MTRFLKELYRKFAIFGGALALMAVTTGAGYDEVDWGNLWMPQSLHPSPVVQVCEKPLEGLLSTLSSSQSPLCEFPKQAELGELDNLKSEKIF